MAHTGIVSESNAVDGPGFVRTTGVQFGLAGLGVTRESADSSDGANATKTSSAGLGTLNSHGLAHDRAAASNCLQVAHSTAAGRDQSSVVAADGGRERTEGSRRRLLQERTHGLRLAEDRVHGC